MKTLTKEQKEQFENEFFGQLQECEGKDDCFGSTKHMFRAIWEAIIDNLDISEEDEELYGKYFDELVESLN